MLETSLFWLLSLALIYLLFTSVIFIRNRYELIPLVNYNEQKSKAKISVCIPARNEEKTISNLISSLLVQTDMNFDIHVLDDESEDQTPQILRSYKKKAPKKLYIHSGKPKPEDWYGKPWACHQLGEAADGEILLFLDADTQLKPTAVRNIRNSIEYYHLDMLTVWPQQILESFWEKVVIPLIYYGLNTILPVIYVYRKPRWMPQFFYNNFTSNFAAANGQCIAFTKQAYQKIGGHSSVKKEIVEDVKLAKQAKNHDLKLRMFSGVDSVSCRMYTSHSEMFNGLRKNFLAGFDNSILLFVAAAVLHLIVFIVPYAGLIWALINGDAALFFLALSSITLTLLHRLILSSWFYWDPIYAFTHPLGVFWFQWLGLVKLYDFFTGSKTLWKGRNV